MHKLIVFIIYNMHLESSDFSFHANFKIAEIINRCSLIPEWNRIVSSWSLYSGSSSTLFPRGRGQVAGGLFPLVSLLFYCLFCCL